MSKLIFNIEYYAVYTLLWLISILPFRVLYCLSDLLYYPLYYVVRYRRKVVRRNLTSSFPAKSHQEIVKIEKRYYHFMLDVIFESCKMMTISPKAISRRIQFENVDKVNALLAEGKSISIFMGHYGNWEWVASMALALYDGAIKAQIYHKLQNRVMEPLLKHMRERFGSMCVEMRQTVRFMAEARAEGRSCIIGFIADQSPKKKEAKYFIPFLNHETAVLTGTEKATEHFRYLPVFLALKRKKRGYYTATITPLEPAVDSTSEYPLTEAYFQRLEQEIIQAPEYYLWSHNRFKHKKPTEGEQ